MWQVICVVNALAEPVGEGGCMDEPPVSERALAAFSTVKGKPPTSKRAGAPNTNRGLSSHALLNRAKKDRSVECCGAVIQTQVRQP